MIKIKRNLIALIVFAIFSCTTEDSTPEYEDVKSQIVFEDDFINENILHSKENSTFKRSKELIIDSKEETPKDNNAINSIFILDGIGGIGGGCDDFVAPFTTTGQTGQLLEVYYDTSIPVDQINCVRQEFFERSEFCYLRLVAYDPGNPYHDIWMEVNNLGTCIRPGFAIDNRPLDPTTTDGVDGKTAVEKATDNDPRLCARKPSTASECN